MCVDQTNKYRASIGRSALTRSAALDSDAAAAAKNDGTNHVSHQYFKQSNGGGVALAENEIPWWPLATLGSVGAVVQEGLQGFWAEGPKGGHYQNIAGPYTEIGCGLFVNGDEVTLTQDFR